MSGSFSSFKSPLQGYITSWFIVISLLIYQEVDTIMAGIRNTFSTFMGTKEKWEQAYGTK